MTPQTVAGLVLTGATLSLGVPIGFKVVGHPPGFMNNLGFRSGPRGSALAWASALVVAAAYVAFSALKMPEIAHHWNRASFLKGVSILAAIAAGIVEEAIFRRWLMDARCLKIESDPHAEGFYRQMGAVVRGHRPANMDGQARTMPLLEKALSPKVHP